MHSIAFAFEWADVYFEFIDNGQNFWIIYLLANSAGQKIVYKAGIIGGLSTILADSIMVCRSHF